MSNYSQKVGVMHPSAKTEGSPQLWASEQESKQEKYVNTGTTTVVQLLHQTPSKTNETGLILNLPGRHSMLQVYYRV